MINITDSATNKLLDILKLSPEYKYVRVGVIGGGCSGFQWTFSLTDTIEEDYKLYLINDITFVVDPISDMYMDGTTIDYKESVLESGFSFSNPNVSHQCGCGKSFTA